MSKEKKFEILFSFIRMRLIFFQSIVLQWIDSFVGARVVNAPLHAELAIDDRVQERGDKERYRGGLEGYEGARGKDKEEAREPDVSPPPTRKGWETVKKKRKEERGWREERHGELEVATIHDAISRKLWKSFAVENRGVLLKYSNFLRLISFIIFIT